MEKSLLIFAGAGASFGVDRELFPTTVQFRENLPDELKNSTLLQYIEAHISRTQNISTIDVEHTLWEIGNLITTLEQATNTTNFLSEALQTNQINNAINISTQGNNILNSLNQIKYEAIQLRDKINSEVYKYYSKDASQQSLEKTWIPLIKKFAARAKRFDIITTNYDQVIEQALQAVQPTSTHAGFTGGHKSTIDLAYWKNINPEIGLLTKLHGSVDWIIGNGGSQDEPVIRHGHPEFHGNHKTRLIIYPGFKGKPKDQPYKLFHDYFATRIAEATHILTIGFAFRDEYINEIFESKIRPETKIAVIDPTENPKWPSFLAKAEHIKSGFGQPIERNGGEIDQFDHLRRWIDQYDEFDNLWQPISGMTPPIRQ
jgi:hypothetical protein